MKKQTMSKTLLIIGIILVVIAIIAVICGICFKLFKKVENPIATIDIQDYGIVKIELYPDKAPNTVTNFICLAENGFYDGLTFHRTIPGFMIQGGDKNGDGTGTPTIDDLKENGDTTEYAIKGEMIANGYSKNNIKLKRGVIAMARSDYSSISPSLTEESYNSAGSQFFIMHEDNTNIDGLYTAFGRVIEGIEIIDKIANLEVTYRSSDLGEDEEIPKGEDGNELSADMPLDKPVINSITIETYGVDYGEPETLETFNYYNYLMQYYNSMMSY